MLFSAVFSGMFDALYKRRYVRVYDAMLLAPVDVEEIVTGEMLFLGVAGGSVRAGAAARDRSRSGVPPAPAMLLVPLITVLTGIGFAALGMLFAALVENFDGLQLRDQRR